MSKFRIRLQREVWGDSNRPGLDVAFNREVDGIPELLAVIEQLATGVNDNHINGIPWEVSIIRLP